MTPTEVDNVRHYALPFLRLIEDMPARPTRAHMLGLAVALGAVAGRAGSPGSAIKECVRIATAHCKVVAMAAKKLRDEQAGLSASKP